MILENFVLTFSLDQIILMIEHKCSIAITIDFMRSFGPPMSLSMLLTLELCIESPVNIIVCYIKSI